MKIAKRIIMSILCLGMFFGMFSTLVQAEVPSQECTLIIDYGYGHSKMPISGAAFRLYKVADFNDDLNFTVVGDFQRYSIQTAGMDQEGWRELAHTLAGYVRRDAQTAVSSGTTNADGKWTPQQTFGRGLYLLMGDTVTVDGHVYSASPTMIVMPQIEGGSWNTECVVSPKAERNLVQEKITRRVLKVWDDEGLDSQRPAEVEVQLLKGETVLETVTLNDGNNWRHEWSALDPAHTWSVVEKDVPAGYTVKSQQEGNTTTLTNTASPCSIDPPVKKEITGDTPSEKATFRFVMEAVSNTAGFDVKGMPMPEGSQDGKMTKDILGAAEFEFGDIYFLKPGTYVYRIYEENTNDAGYTYDTTRYTVTAVVTDNNGRLSAERTIQADENAATEIVFKNKYTATDVPPTKPEVITPSLKKLPQTGPLWWIVVLLAFGGVLMLAIGMVMRKGRRNDK